MRPALVRPALVRPLQPALGCCLRCFPAVGSWLWADPEPHTACRLSGSRADAHCAWRGRDASLQRQKPILWLWGAAQASLHSHQRNDKAKICHVIAWDWCMDGEQCRGRNALPQPSNSHLSEERIALGGCRLVRTGKGGELYLKATSSQAQMLSICRC